MIEIMPMDFFPKYLIRVYIFFEVFNQVLKISFSTY